jgi:photosystem II stability/assembly factor-like uncharacterized protein
MCPAQSTWHALPTAPFMVSKRIDDCCFVNERVGWVGTGTGQIWKTTDAGESWNKQFDRSTVYFRCIAFADSLRGWACNLGTEEFGGATDTNIIFQTSDGGATWGVNDSIWPQKPRGLCGMQAVGDSFVYAVGRVRGPAFFVRSTDGGRHWQTRDMSAFAMGLLDCYFFTPDSGLAVGHTGPVNSSSSGVVLFTSDRGTTWAPRYTTSQSGEWCWKIDFPTRQTGYISLQRNTGSPVNFLKTTDGGVTWEEKRFSDSPYYVQGIGFADELHGWVGGNSTLPTYVTTDGGTTWQAQPFGVRVNRFQFITPGIGFAVGQTVYRYSPDIPSGVSERKSAPTSMVLLRVFPNPFNSTTRIEYTVVGGGDDPATPLEISIGLYDLLGRKVRDIAGERRRPGTYSLFFDAMDLSSGMYFIRLIAQPGHDGSPSLPGRYVESQKLLLLR